MFRWVNHFFMAIRLWMFNMYQWQGIVSVGGLLYIYNSLHIHLAYPKQLTVLSYCTFLSVCAFSGNEPMTLPLLMQSSTN